MSTSKSSCTRRNFEKEDLVSTRLANERSLSWHVRAVVGVVLLVTIAPTIIFIQTKISDAQETVRSNSTSERHGQGSIWSCRSVEYSQLTESVCNPFLSHSWPLETKHNDSGHVMTESVEVATVAKCGLDTTEKELTLLLNLHAFATPTCIAAGFPSFLCRYFIRPCEVHQPISQWSGITADKCQSFKEESCRTEWTLLQHYVDTRDTCLTIPDCGSILEDSNESHRQDSTIKTSTKTKMWKSTGSSTSLAKPLSRTAMPERSVPAFFSKGGSSKAQSFTVKDICTISNDSCKTPFVKPQDSELACAPPCPPEDTVMELSSIAAFKAVAYISFIVECICSLIIFYTFFKATEIRRFPHNITLIMALLNFIGVVILSIPFLVGQHRTMCWSDEFLSNLLHKGTKFCVIQGGTVHFILLSTLSWFCCSVFNVLVAIMTFSTDHVIKRYPKALFLLEFVLSTVIPGGIVAAVYKTQSYKPDVLLMYLCIPTNYDTIFYSYTLPFQIYCFCIVAMCVLIIRRIKQRASLRSALDLVNERANVARNALARRFSVIAVTTPMLFLAMFTLVETFISHEEKSLANGALAFAVCKLCDAPQGTMCSNSASMNVYMSMVMFESVYLAAFSVLLVVYSFIPKPAREVWAKQLKRIRRVIPCFRLLENIQYQ